MTDVIYEMSSKKLGMTTVQEDGQLRGVISDGDLRRLLEREGGAALSRDGRRGDECASADDCGRRIGGERAGDSRRAEDHFAGGGGRGERVEGVVHLHDLWGVELI